ncbi:Aste57867_11567 [Aphanomyces stellatus]|uniref:Aste57867_11567 protein n=1 Tax=Aphanomyces stellatus TaxID=120398 RepID=A0A485KTQ2_9STRA|nr:hypothetical protein As57867_011524 [Aphanomyces stellatus]VFT88426.1 Aste57867_11567 [Aphanomyces stellatus]
MVTIIVTGFGKFGDVIDNPTTHLAKHLTEDPHANSTTVLEVSAEGVRAAMQPMWDEAEASTETTVFVHFGVKRRATTIELEQVGYNIADFRMPDERGWVAQAEVIDATEGDSLQTHLPLDEILAACQAQGCNNMSISTDPGRYICNYTYFLSLVHAKKRATKNQYALFVHVPPFSVISENEQLEAVQTLLAVLHKSL